jgi:pimeloyl-ACP methyl ester carboxylesterase
MTSTHEQRTTEMPTTYADASTQRVSGGNGVEYAYRDVGTGDVPLVLLQHFRGNLDNWDPALVDALAAERRVVTFDNVGVAATTGATPAPSRRWRTAQSPSSRRSDAACRFARLLDRQLRRAGDRADPPRPTAARRVRVRRASGCDGHARVGASGDRGGRWAADEP